MAKEHVVKEGAKVRKSTGDRIVDVIIYVALGLIALSTEEVLEMPFQGVLGWLDG